jgi:AraC-like DNA-binding protein
MELAAPDRAASSCAGLLSFPDELHAFVSRCQVLSAAVWTRELALREIALDLSASLPHPRCSADFLLLRSIVAEFAMRAVETTLPRGTDAVWPLVRLKPGERSLREVLVDCLSGVDANAAHASDGASASARRATRALAIIAARCGEPGLDARAVASEVRLSPRELGNLLHTHGGAGFRTLLRRARVKAAEDLLGRSAYSVKEIAARVGYSWTSQFDRDFLRERGVTPGQYRAAQR